MPERLQRRHSELHHRRQRHRQQHPWAGLNGSLTVPSCTLTTANFYIEGASAGTDIYLDDVSLREQL